MAVGSVEFRFQSSSGLKLYHGVEGTMVLKATFRFPGNDIKTFMRLILGIEVAMVRYM